MRVKQIRQDILRVHTECPECERETITFYVEVDFGESMSLHHPGSPAQLIVLDNYRNCTCKLSTNRIEITRSNMAENLWDKLEMAGSCPECGRHWKYGTHTLCLKAADL